MLLHAVSRAVVRTLLAAVLVALLPGHLLAYYEESHITADDVRIILAPSGVVRVEHSIVWRLVAGQPKSFDLIGSEPSAELEPSSVLEADDGQRLLAALAPVPGRGIRVNVLEPKQLRHGHTYKLRVAYSVNLSTTGELVRDGAYYRLTWKGLAHGEGYDGSTVAFLLPASVEPPSAFVAAPATAEGTFGGMVDDGVTTTLKRSADHDELVMTRPHVGRGEQAVWALRIPARSLDGPLASALPPAPPPPRHDVRSNPSPSVYGLLAVTALAFAAASGLSAGRRSRGLVPLPAWERTALGAATLFAGMSLQLSGERILGAASVVIAMGCTVLSPIERRGAQRRDAWGSWEIGGRARVVEERVRARGPGVWLVLRPEDAFRPEGARGPVSLLAGAIIAVLLGLLTASLLVAGATGVQPEASLALPLDAVVLLPLVLSLPHGERDASVEWLRRTFALLKPLRRVKCSPWARVPVGQHDPDDLRLLVMPRDTVPGFLALEVGVGEGGPEVLVRVTEESAAAAKLSSVTRSSTPGRSPVERAYRFFADDSSPRATAALVVRLTSELEDRRTRDDRATVDVWCGPERRLPRGEATTLSSLGAEIC